MTDCEPESSDRAAETALAAEIRRRRLAAGLSQAELATRIGYSREYVSRGERPTKGLASAELVHAIDAALDAGGALVALHNTAREGRVARRRRTAPDDALVSRLTPGERYRPMLEDHGGEHEAERMSREEFLRLAAFALVSGVARRDDAGVVVGLGRGDAAARHGFRPTRVVVEEDVDPITRRHRSLYHQMPSADLLPAVLGHLQMVDKMLGRAEDGLRPDLASTVAETAGLAAWLYSDLGNNIRMLRLYGLADEAIAASGDRALGGYISGFRAQLLARRGEHLRALQRAESARDQAGQSASPILRAWLTAVHAVALAYAGHAAPSRRALTDAERHLGAGTDAGPEWMYEFDRARLCAYSGICHLRLGEPQEAERALREALAALPATCGRRRADVSVNLAYALLAEGELDEAIHLAGTATETFGAWESTAGLGRVTSFCTTMEQNGHRDVARSLQEQVLAAGPSW